MEPSSGFILAYVYSVDLYVFMFRRKRRLIKSECLCLSGMIICYLYKFHPFSLPFPPNQRSRFVTQVSSMLTDCGKRR